MALSKIRRIAIAIVGFLLFVNLVLLGVARFGSSKATAGPMTYDVVAWIEKESDAEALKSKLAAVGLTASVSGVKRDVQVPAGYRLVMDGTPELLEPIQAALKLKKYPVKLVADGTELQLGGVYQDKAKAEAKAKSVLKSDKFNFQVRVATKSVSKSVQEIRIAGIDEAARDQVQSILEGKVLEMDIRPVEGDTRSSDASPG